MPMFLRKRAFSSKFYRVIVDERCISRIAGKLQEHTRDSQKSLTIEIVAAERSEIITTSDPSFFLDNNLPNSIDSIHIAFKDQNLPIACEISFLPFGRSSNQSVFEAGYVLIEVNGIDKQASGLFHELCDDLVTIQTWGTWIPRLTETFIFMGLCFVTSVLASIAGMYWVLSYVLDYTAIFDGGVPTFMKVFISTVVAGNLSMLWVPRLILLIRNQFPSIIFSGNLSPSQNTHSKIFSVAIVGIIVSLTGNAVWEIIRYFTTLAN